MLLHNYNILPYLCSGCPGVDWREGWGSYDAVTVVRLHRARGVVHMLFPCSCIREQVIAGWWEEDYIMLIIVPSQSYSIHSM